MTKFDHSCADQSKCVDQGIIQWQNHSTAARINEVHSPTEKLLQLLHATKLFCELRFFFANCKRLKKFIILFCEFSNRLLRILKIRKTRKLRIANPKNILLANAKN